MEAETKRYKGHNIVIKYDENPESPRDWDNLCEIHYGSSRYILGDTCHTDQESIDNMLAEAKRQGDLVFSLYAYIHSGVTISLGDFYGRLPQGHAEFDSGQCGLVIVRRKKMLEEFNSKTFTAKLKQKARKIVEAEIETFDSYLRGDVYGYVIEEDGDSCWGFYSIKDAMEAAKESVDYIVEQDKKKHFEQIKKWIRSKTPFRYRTSFRFAMENRCIKK